VWRQGAPASGYGLIGHSTQVSALDWWSSSPSSVDPSFFSHRICTFSRTASAPFLAPHLHPNRDRPGARPPIPILRIPLARYGRLAIDVLTIGVSIIAIVQGPTWVLALVIPLLIALAVTSWRNNTRVIEDLAAHVFNRHPDHEQ
jgi:hypothetical protein